MKKPLAIIGTVLLATMLTACGGTAGTDAVAIGGTFTFVSPGGQTVITYPAAERQPVGAFTGDSLMEPGTEITLDDFPNQVVVLNAWGQWCGPCRSEVDDLQVIHEELGDAGTVLGINVKDPSRQAAQDFVHDNGVTYPSIYDPPFRSSAALGGVPASVIPTTVVLDKQHRPAAVFLKEVTADEVLDVVTSLLSE
ncbi:MAG: TlpA disulfide reductase family protein [Corynebacterium sp.]|nr:TlpA disulfide reductase family protein [Corynebacterium sp.]